MSAADVRGTLAVVRCEHRTISPAYGLLLHAAPQPLNNAFDAAGVSASSLSAGEELLRQLLHHSVWDEPLSVSRNRSNPAPFLTPKLLGGMVGLALSKASEARVETTLRDLGVAQIARETGVTIARFARLVGLLQSSLQEHASGRSMLPCPPAALMSRVLWEISSSRADVSSYLLTVHSHIPVLSDDAPILRPVHSAAWRSWHEASFGPADLKESIPSLAAELLDACVDEVHWARLFEQLAFRLCATGQRARVPLGSFGYLGHPPAADCVEQVLRELLDFLLFDGHSWATERLPSDCLPSIRTFYTHAAQWSESDRGQRWFDLCSALPGVRYLRGEQSCQYELVPCLKNVLVVLIRLLGAPEVLVGNWEGFACWWSSRSYSRPELRVSERDHDPHTILFVQSGADELLEVRMVPHSLHAYTRRLNGQRSHHESVGTLLLPLWRRNAPPDGLHLLLPLMLAPDSAFRAAEIPPESLLSINAFVRFRDSVDGPGVAHVTWARLQSMVEWPGGRVNEALQILECALRHPSGFKAIRKMGACRLAACRSAETTRATARREADGRASCASSAGAAAQRASLAGSPRNPNTSRHGCTDWCRNECVLCPAVSRARSAPAARLVLSAWFGKAPYKISARASA